MLTPLECFIKELNTILVKFLWNGKDKVTRLSVINNYEQGGFKMTDVDSMIKSLRLAWFSRIFNNHKSIWKEYLK
jgi:hypothetical protein